MSLPLWKAQRIIKAGGFNAALTKEAEAVVEAAEAEGPVEVDEDVQLPDIP